MSTIGGPWPSVQNATLSRAAVLAYWMRGGVLRSVTRLGCQASLSLPTAIFQGDTALTLFDASLAEGK
jgi:hypothetical protein